MAVMDQEAKNVKFALMGNFSLWKASAMPKILTVHYFFQKQSFFPWTSLIIRTDDCPKTSIGSEIGAVSNGLGDISKGRGGIC